MKKNHVLVFFLMILLFSALGFSATNPTWTTGITINPPSPHDGEVVRFTATLKVKLGPVGNLRIIGGVDGSIIYDETFTNLPQGYTKQVGFKWIATAATPCTAYFQLDPDRTSGDVTPGDNRVSKTFNVSPIADLVADVSYQPTPNGWTCEEVTFTVKAVNQGSRPSNACLMGFAAGSENYSFYEIPGLQPGQANAYTFFIKRLFTVANTYKFNAWVDYHDDVEESNNNNNRKSGAITILKCLPDLFVSASPDPNPVKIGRRCFVTVWVQNPGHANAPSPPTTVELICSGDKGPKKRGPTNVPSLAVGEKWQYVYSFKYWTKGSRRCAVWVDRQNLIEEMIEVNNEYKFSIKVELN